MPGKLADYDDPLVRATALALTKGEDTDRGRITSIFHYVRDTIRFGFPAAGDLVSASETIRLGFGQCNTKGTLFLALCKAAGIPARLHFSLIRKEIQRGLFTGIAYRLMPPLISHSWLEVQVDGTWRKLDSYINDEPFHESAKAALRQCGWDTGFSVACSSGESSAALNLDEEKFAQMDAVAEDQGTWDDPDAYYASPAYRNRPNLFKLLMYRILIGDINRKVERLRQRATLESPMNASSLAGKRWINWLTAVSAGVIAFGLLLVLAPGLARQGFSLMVYAAPTRIDTFGDEQVRYIALAHAVIGGVMVGWGVAMLYAARALLAKGRREGWHVIAISVVAWYVPDTAFSIWSGFWQNAVLNTVFLTLFAIPLWATRHIR